MIVLNKVTVEIPVARRGIRSSVASIVKQRVGGVVSDPSQRRITVRALHNVTFQLGAGGRLGLIGHNGAGKTTLLKTLAGLYPITSGEIQVDGSIRTFFNLSAGLDPNRSGYTNIKNIAFYYTQDIREIEALIPSIVEFSELGEFIDFPVSTYSAGMLARLIVSIALNFEGDILVMDEMLGAGDAMFMKKVNGRLERMVQDSKILVFASHATEIIRQFCTTAIWLEKGEIRMMGDVIEVTDAFHLTL
jgi:ABC-type polysaccharide/polyol phosphate transport system ATPase subunit